MEEPLTILYTANLRGSLERLPRLHTFLRQLKNQRPADESDVMLCMVEPVVRRTLLLDAGNACAPDAWHCAATGGRSALIVLDAMGYHAANVSGFLSPEGRARLDANYLGMALVDESNPWRQRNVTVTCGDKEQPTPLPQGKGNLRIVLPGVTPPPNPLPARQGGSAKTLLSMQWGGNLGEGIRNHTLYLPLIAAAQVGVIHVAWESGVPVIRAHAVLDMPSNTPPDPTITASVEFVLAEARRLE